MKKLFLQSGKLMVGEFSEEPNEKYFSGDQWKEKNARVQYQAAVSAAKVSAVECDPGASFYKSLLNAEGISTGEGSEQEIVWAINSLKEGQLYEMPEGWTVEFEYYVSDVNDPTVWQVVTPELYEAAKKHPESGRSVKQEARLIPLKEQSGTVATGVPERDTTANDRTEPTVNTIIDRIGELYEGLKDLHHAQEVYDKSGEFFASLQELRNIACVAVKSVSPPPQTESRHKYEPEPEHPQFCRQCGYAEHVKLKHF